MDNKIFKLYQMIEQEKISNNRESIYWIFHIESILTKENGVSKRYLKVLFFNRFMNENNQLMRLYLRTHSEMIEKDDFVVSNEYRNPNIMGFLLERDLIDESKGIEITGYVINGKKYDLANDIMVGFPYINDQQKFQAFMDFTNLLTKDMITAPYFDQEKWVCACGFANRIDDDICPICAAKKTDMQFLYNMDIEELVLTYAQNELKLNCTQQLNVIISQYIKHIHQKYGVDQDKLLASLDMKALVHNHQELLKSTIDDYITTQPFEFSMHFSFEQCLKRYIGGVVNDAITEEMVLAVLDVPKLQRNYIHYQQEHERIAKAKKRKMILFGSIGTIAIAALVVFQIIFAPKATTEGTISQNDDNIYEGIEILNTYEARKAACANSNTLDQIVNPKLKTVMQENQLCDFDFNYTQEPKINITTVGNKKIRPLDEKHVMVMQTDKIDENAEKIVMYIADLNGNKVYGNTDQDYMLKKYENGKVIQDEIYFNQKLVKKGIYIYEEDDKYQINVKTIDGQDERLETIIIYENGKKVQEKYFSYGDLLSVNKYSYQGENIIEKNQYRDSDTYEKLKCIKYVNGLPIEQQSFEDGIIRQTDKYYFDYNGLLAVIERYDNNDLMEKHNFSYDFNEGKEFEWVTQFNAITNQKYKLYNSDIELWDYPYYVFDELFSFNIDVETIVTLYNKIPNLYNNLEDTWGQAEQHIAETFIDADGQVRTEGIKLDITNYENGVLFYRLGKLYTTLTGTLVADEFASEDIDVSLIINGDGVEIYRKDHIKKGDEVNFKVDVNGIKELRIECSSTAGSGDVYIINTSLE